MAAAGGDLVPIPVAGTIAASTVQARLLHKLGGLYGIKWDRRAYADLSAAIGAGTLLKIASQIGLRQLVKMIPAYGQTAGAAASAAASFALTYALGKAAVYYLHRRRMGTDRQGRHRPGLSAVLARRLPHGPRTAACRKPTARPRHE